MIQRWIITGDTHRVFTRFDHLDKTPNTGIIILGDAGLNYTLDINDRNTKEALCRKYPYDFYCVRGNHEARPEDVPTMELVYDEEVKGLVWMEEELPRIKYFTDWGFYEIDGLRTLVIGGAYSVDKWYRLQRGAKWFANEQLTQAEMNACYMSTYGRQIDLVLSHTLPYNYLPTDMFLKSVNQSSVDNTMEEWLQKISQIMDWKIWLGGHFHTDRIQAPYVEIFYQEMELLQDIVNRWNNYTQTKELDWWLPLSPQMKKFLDRCE